MERKLTCIVCPMGCELVAEIENEKVISVKGNTCPRGKAYAETECISPMRTVTTTVKTKDGVTIPVKTDRTIPKKMVLEAMKIINKANPHLPIHIGDVIVKDVYGANVVATRNVE